MAVGRVGPGRRRVVRLLLLMSLLLLWRHDWHVVGVVRNSGLLLLYRILLRGISADDTVTEIVGRAVRIVGLCSIISSTNLIIRQVLVKVLVEARCHSIVLLSYFGCILLLDVLSLLILLLIEHRCLLVRLPIHHVIASR